MGRDFERALEPIPAELLRRSQTPPAKYYHNNIEQKWQGWKLRDEEHSDLCLEIQALKARAEKAEERVKELEGLPLKVKDETSNCYAACISSITGLPFELLRLSKDEIESLDSTSLQTKMNKRMESLGWWRIPMFQRIPRGLAIAAGPSPRGDFQHAVVVHNGEFFHDPHPSGAYLDDIDYYEVLIRLQAKTAVAIIEELCPTALVTYHCEGSNCDSNAFAELRWAEKDCSLSRGFFCKPCMEQVLDDAALSPNVEEEKC